MAKIQFKNPLNNPEKNVPDEIVQKFFLEIRTGDIDKIRLFVNNNKNRYNLFETHEKNKGNTVGSGKTAVHVVLELDDKIANNETKLMIIKYLASMGAPLDYPDSANIWPIHLAVALQSRKIIDFLINQRVSLNRKDSSNNTPLHYAMIGQEVACPKISKIGSLTPTPEFKKLSLNESLIRINNDLIKLISQNATINADLINMINTIMNIPEMYKNDDMEKNLEADIVSVFSDVALDPRFPSSLNAVPKLGGMTAQQNRLEQIINKNYAVITDDLLAGVTSPLHIVPNNKGWGPSVNDATGIRPPTNLERILDQEEVDITKEMENDLATSRQTVINTPLIDAFSKVENIITTIDSGYIDALVFGVCTNCKPHDLGEDVMLTKMLFLLLGNNFTGYYVDFFARKIMNQFKLVDPALHVQILRWVIPNYDQIPILTTFDVNRSGVLFNSSLAHLVNDPIFAPVRAQFDIYDLLHDIVQLYNPDPATSPGTLRVPIAGGINGCIGRGLIKILTYNNDAGSIDLLNRASLFQTRFSELSEFRNQAQQLGIANNTWFTELLAEIRLIRPVPAPAPGLNSRVDDIFRRGGNFIIPLTPLPNDRNYNTGNVSGRVNKYNYYDLMRIMHLLYYFLLTSNFHASDFPDIFRYPIGQWLSFLRDTIAPSIVKTTGRTIMEEYPVFLFLYEVLIKLTQAAILDIIRACLQGLIKRVNDDNSGTSVVQNLKNYINNIKPIDDAIMMNLLLPANPAIDQFTAVPGPFDKYKNIKWTLDNKLVQDYNNFITANPVNFDDLLDAIILSNVDLSDYTALDRFRQFVEVGAVTFREPISSVIRNPNFRTIIQRYLGIGQNVANRKIDDYHSVTVWITLDNIFNYQIDDLKNHRISDVFFLTEYYNYVFVYVKQTLIYFRVIIGVADRIKTDIIAFIRTSNYYYPAQIFLPALIIQLLKVIYEIVRIINICVVTRNQYSRFMDLIDQTNKINMDIINLGNGFLDYVYKFLMSLDPEISNYIKFHNDVIDYLNNLSGNRLINAQKVSDRAFANTLFTQNLIKIRPFPEISRLVESINDLSAIIRDYRIPEITYYGKNVKLPPNKNEIFTRGNDANVRIALKSYRGIELERAGSKISNSPFAGNNNQAISATITINKAGIPTTDYYIYMNKTALSGEWLDFQPNRLDNVVFGDAFIDYSDMNYEFEWLTGMPPSIRNLLASYAKFVKQKIIQNVIQYVEDNKSLIVGTPNSTQELYQILENLGNESTYFKLSNVKIYVVLGKLLDDILNKIFEYAIRQSITSLDH